MPKFIVETISNRSNKKGPIDPKTGFPTFHPSLIKEASNLKEAKKYFEKKFPGDVLDVYEEF